MLSSTVTPSEKRQALRGGLASGTLQRFPGAFTPLTAPLTGPERSPLKKRVRSSSRLAGSCPTAQRDTNEKRADTDGWLAGGRPSDATGGPNEGGITDDRPSPTPDAPDAPADDPSDGGATDARAAGHADAERAPGAEGESDAERASSTRRFDTAGNNDDDERAAAAASGGGTDGFFASSARRVSGSTAKSHVASASSSDCAPACASSPWPALRNQSIWCAPQRCTKRASAS